MAISFGTGGLRGLMGPGEDCINEGTVARASRGVAAYLLRLDADKARRGGVAVAYDTRHQSESLAQAAASAFLERGLPVHAFDEPTPTPVLSFAVRFLGCAGGVVITASHNTREYNGYKVYNADGGQLVPKEAEAVTRHIGRESMDPPPPGIARPVPKRVREAFLRAVRNQSLLQDAAAKRALVAVYTPLHGSGSRYVRRALEEAGFSNILSVPEQEAPDGDFPTVKSPNPESRDALAMAIELSRKAGADIALGTDPDCDRVGAAVRHGGEYRLITGNQMGALLIDYLLRQSGEIPENGAVIKTIVTSDLGVQIACDAGLFAYETLTGFKFIGERIGQFERTGRHTFFFGYEESYGYLRGTHARDKDAVVASLLLCEMAALYKKEGFTLVDRLNALFSRYGFYAESMDVLPVDSLARMKAWMRAFRAAGPDLFSPPAEMRDYLRGRDGLPPSDVIKFFLRDGSWVAVRPSGTEPEVKVYYGVRGRSEREAQASLEVLRRAIRRIAL